MNILAIESSCDETSAAILTEKEEGVVLLSNVVSSQIDIHKEYGGVVPEVAARAHIENILPVIKKALKDAKMDLNEIDYITPTYGPGLIGSLLVGVETAKSLSISKNIPLIPINHLEGHLYANFIYTARGSRLKAQSMPQFPIVALIVSGGHTILILMKKHLEYEIIGKTRDDAAGEAFDKVAKILGLGYPGGPIISQLAENGNENVYEFPIVDLTKKPYRDKNQFLRYPEPSLDFSFSGLKTALLSKTKTLNLTPKTSEDLAASFQKCIIDNLTQNSLRAIEKHKPKTFILSGGVAANKALRSKLKKEVHRVSPSTAYLVPQISLCTDNAAMIGMAGYYHIKKDPRGTLDFVSVPSLKLS